ncbi:MAG: hypothetical protein U0T73_06140 [Chitinophagales bacterium]
MRKKLSGRFSAKISRIIVFLSVFFFASHAFSQTTSLWASYAILSLNGGTNAYYDLSAVSGNPDFQGANLGNFSSGNSIVIKGGQNKTNKCSGGNVTGSNIYYRVWLTSAGASGSFNSISESFLSNDGGTCGGDQTWEGTGGTTNILTGLTPGNYTIEVYADAPGFPSTQYASNGGANYKATFTYCGPTSGALPVGNYAIPGCFATVQAAVSYINTNGVSGTGTVQFDIAAGGSETAPAGGITITATGTATTAIKFVKASGAAYTITAASTLTSGSLSDAIIKIVGGDYITIDGLTLQENSSNTTTTSGSNNMTEFGVGLFYATTTNGAQNNTIQNCTISLNRTYSNTFGIFSSTNSTATTVTTSAVATSSAGSNSNNKFYSNTISNVNAGIALLGSTTAAAMDAGNDVGGSSSATGNTFTNWGGQTAAGAFVGGLSVSTICIYSNHQTGENISNNTMTSFTITSGTDIQVRGILKRYTSTQPTGTFTSNINNNTITLTTPFVTNYPVAIGCQDITSLSTATININSNILKITQSGAATSPMYGIYNGSVVGTINMNLNQITGFTSAQTSGGYYGIQNTGACITAININNNQIGNGTTGAVTFTAGTSGGIKGIENTAGAATCALSISGNNFQGFTHSVGATGAYNFVINSAATLSQTLSSNTFTNLSINTTGGVTFISDNITLPASGSKVVNSNRIITAFNNSGSGGNVYCYNNGGGSSPATSSLNFKFNNFSNMTFTGNVQFYGILDNDGTSGSPGLKTYSSDTFSNINIGTPTSTAVIMSPNYGSGSSVVSNNIISGVTSSGTANLDGILVGSSMLSGTAVFSNTIKGLSCSGIGAQIVYGIYNQATGASIYSNTIDTLKQTGTTASTATVFGIYSATSSNSIYNNVIYDLSTAGLGSGAQPVGISNTATSTAPNIYGNTIYNIFGANTFVAGITNSGNGNIYANKVYGISTSNTGSATAYGIYTNPSTTGQTANIYNNIIGDLSAPNAAWAAPVLPSSIGIGMLNTSTASTSFTNIYYNTIYLNATAAVNQITSGLYFSFGSTPSPTRVSLRNNIVNNSSSFSGTGRVCAISTFGNTEADSIGATSGTVSNNNIYYAGTPSANNTILTKNLNGTVTNYQTFCDYQTFVNPKETASGTESTAFLSTTGSNSNYLHIDPSVATLAEGKAQVISTPSITTDFDGNTRSGTTPDIGADEGTFTAVTPATPGIAVTQTTTANVGRGGISQPILTIAITTGATGSTLTSVTCNTNGSTAPSTDITNAKLYYGGTLSALNTGTMPTLGTTVASPSGSFTFSGFSQSLPCAGTTFYLFLTYDIPCTATGGNVVDAECNSLTLGGSSVVPTIQAPSGNRTITGPMSGNYTIGVDYSSIQLAVADLNSRGISGNTWINIPAGYTETNVLSRGTIVNFSLVCPSAQPNASQRLYFQKSGSGANPVLSAATGSAATPATTTAGTFLDGIFALSGTDYTTIDGLDLNDPNSSNYAEYGYAFFKNSATDGCQNDTIKNCTITMKNANNAIGSTEFDAGSKGIWMGNTLFSALGTGITVTNVTGTHSNNFIYNNTITGAYNPIYSRGYSSTTYYNNNNTIRKNTLNNWGSSTGVTNCQGIYQIYNSNSTIDSNTIDNAAGGGSGHFGGILYGVYLNTASSAAVTLLNNSVKLSMGANNASSMYGFYVSPSGALNIKFNQVKNCSQATGATGNFYGIYTATSTATSVNIYGNSVSNNTLLGGFNGINTSGGVSSVVDSNFCNSNTTTSNNSFTGISNNNATTSQSTSMNQVNSNSAGASGFDGIAFIMGTASTMKAESNQINGNSVSGGSSVCRMIYGQGAGATPTSYSVSYNTANGFTANNNTGGIYGYTNSASYSGTGYRVVGNTFNNLQLTGSPGSASISGITDANGGSPAKTIDSNTITNLSTTGTGLITGIYMSFASGNSISDNVMTDFTTNGSIYGVNLASGTGNTNFYRNRMCNFTGNGSGSIIYGFNQTGGSTMNYANNVLNNFSTPIGTVAASPYQTIIGFYLTAGTKSRVFNNTVRFNSTSTGSNFSSSVIYMSTGVNTLVHNNIFINTSTPSGSGKTSIIYRTGTTVTQFAADSAKNNIYFVSATPSASKLLYWDPTNTSTYQALSNFTSGTYSGYEGSSDTVNLPFITTTCSASNLLLPDTTNGQICKVEGKGRPYVLGYLGTDIRRNTRNVTTPDPGAFEFSETATVTAQTGDTGVCLGNNAVFRVVATGPNLTYQWQKNGVNISNGATGNGSTYSGATTNILTINAVASGDAGAFQCVMKPCGTGTTVNSTPLNLSINTPVSITLQPVGDTICAGDNITFSVAATGTGVSYQWQVNNGGGFTNISNGGVYSGATTANLTLTSATYSLNGYQYRCVISGTCSAAGNSNSVLLGVNAANSWVGSVSSDWNDAANWCPPAVPTSSSNISIPSATTYSPIIGISGANAVCNNLTIASGATLTVQSGYTLTFTQGATFSNNGSFVAGSGTETVIFAGGGSGTSALGGSSVTKFNRVELNCGVNMNGGNDTIISSMTIKANGFVTTGSAPFYQSGSSLIYNTGGSYTAGEEWYKNTFGNVAGVPFKVIIASGTNLNFGAATFNREVRNDITINGGLTLSTASNGDLRVKGNWVRGSSGTFTPNCRAVIFNGSGTQSVQVNGGGTETFNFLGLNHTGTFKPSNASGNVTHLKITGGGCSSPGSILSLINTGTVDLNGNIIAVDNSTASVTDPTAWIYVDGSRTITNSAGVGGSGSFAFSGSAAPNTPGNATVGVHNNSGTGSLTFDSSVVVTIADGFVDFGKSGSTYITTVKGVLQINLGGSVGSNSTNNACIFSVGSTLRFANTVDFQVVSGGKTWASGSTGAGVPYNVEVRDSGTDLSIQDTRFVTNNLTVTNGTLTLNTGIGPFSVGGNWSRSGSTSAFKPNNVKVVFNGTSAQTISCSTNNGYETFYQQEISNSNGVTLNSTDDSVTNNLILTSGKLNTGSNQVYVVTTSSGAVSGASATSYVNGNLKRNVTAGTSYDFPVGTSGNFELANVTFDGSMTGTSNLSAHFNSSWSGTTVDSAYCVINGSRITDALDGGYWTITPDAQPTGGSYTVSLSERGYSNAPSLATTMGVIKRSNSSDPWRGCGKRFGVDQNLGTHTNATQSISGGTATAERSGVTSFSDFAVGLGVDPYTALPVKLLYFTAEKNGEDAQLRWATATEINNDHFEIERSTDGVRFAKVGAVKGSGNSATTKTYQQKDLNITVLGVPVVYYRLKQVDADGKFEYSNIASINMSGIVDGFHIEKVFNNPFRDNLTLTYFTPEETTISFGVYDIRGAEIIREEQHAVAGFNAMSFQHLKELSPGIYLMKITNGLEVYSIRVQKIN